MRRATLAIMAILLGTPATAGGLGADGYSWGVAPPSSTEVLVTIVYHKSRAELLDSFAKSGGESSLEDGQDKSGPIYAYSVVNTAEHRCTIHALNPARKYTPQYLGHELLHCLHGQWHPQQ